MSKTVFVANIPYDVSEELLASVFSEAGPVSSVEIKFDPQTGRSKGYAFVHFYDEATAQSAVRNLHEVPVNGRNLRVELSADDGAVPKRRRPGPPGGGGSVPPMDGPADGPVNLDLLPPGHDVPAGQSTDAISRTLAAVPPGQMQDVMAGMKTLIATQPEQARQLLQSKPQLAYALFQAMLLLNIVDPSVLQRIAPAPPAHATHPASALGPAPQPPQQSYRPFVDPRFQAQAPPPLPVVQQPPPLPPSAQAALATLPEDQRAQLLQVLQMSPAQIAALDPNSQASINTLRQQFLGV